jgi:porphobilinogen deaminase
VLALPVEVCVPEAGQGAVVVQTREHVCDSTGFAWSCIDHVATRRTALLERAIAHELGGGCTRPVGVHADLGAGRIHAFVSAARDEAGRSTALDVMGLELATLLSTDDVPDIDDAAIHAGGVLGAMLRTELGMET